MSNDNFDVDLFESLSNSGAINCNLCKNLLSVPIMIVKDIGNLCDSCYAEGQILNKWQGIPNPSIEAVLNIIKVLCPNREFGCKEILLHKDLQDHKIHCKFIPRTCPISEISKCTFRETTAQLMLHIKENHKNDILIPTNNTYVVQIQQCTTQFVTWLQTEEYLIRMSIIIDVDRTMTFLLSNIFNSTSYEATVTITGENENVSTQYNFQVTPTDSSSILVHLASLTDVNSDDTTTFTCVFIIQKCGRKKEIKWNENILQKHLSCPVCTSIMKAPIYICTNGHNTCTNCFGRLPFCHSCRVYLGRSIRNYALENIVADVTPV